MPGLMRGVARTAVVAGTATAVSNRVSRRQANRWSSQEQQQYQQAPPPPQYQQPPPQQYYEPAPPPPPPPAAASTTDLVTELKQLAELRDQGILTDAEFSAQKAKLLGS